MPVGTVTTEPQRHELKTLPPDGFVRVRPLPYGMVLERRDKGTRMSMEQEVRRGKQRGYKQNEPETQRIELETLSEWMVQHDFPYCIVEHNITDVNDVLLDFTNPMAIKSLDPRVGGEIERILSDLNEVQEDDATLEDFTTRRTSSLQESQEPSKEPVLKPA